MDDERSIGERGLEKLIDSLQTARKGLKDIEARKELDYSIIKYQEQYEVLTGGHYDGKANRQNP